MQLRSEPGPKCLFWQEHKMEQSFTGKSSLKTYQINIVCDWEDFSPPTFYEEKLNEADRLLP